MTSSLKVRFAAEFTGTALLLAVVVGSGIMGERLSPGNSAVALLANSLATAGGLYLLIEFIGPISGAHLNPLVTATLGWRRSIELVPALAYVAMQLAGAVAGTWLAHLMFGLDVLEVSEKLRPGLGQIIGEIVATSGLIALVLRAPVQKASIWIALYIGTAYWFTSSTSFANPAAILGRMLTNTFSGIAPASTPSFLLGEVVGAIAATALLAAARTGK